MALQFVPASILYYISASIMVTLAFITWRMKPKRGGAWVGLLTFAFLWTIGVILESLMTDMQLKMRAVGLVSYLAVGGIVFFWAYFTIVYTHHEQWLNKFTIGFLALVPIANYIIVNTTELHNLFWSERFLIEKNGFVYLGVEYGFLFWLWVIYVYSIILGGAILLIRAIIRHPKVYQGQALMLILGATVPLIFNFVYLLGFNPIDPMDLAPVGFVMSGIFITIGLLRFRLFDLTPIAHDLVFNGVTSGVIIMDLDDNITDLNPAAEKIFAYDKNKMIGKKLSATFPEYQSLFEQFDGVTDVHTEISVGVEQSVYEVQIMPLTDRRGESAGRIVMLYDITERDKLINELDAYASTVAHDLKNPLSLIVGHTNLIKRKSKETLPENVQNSLNVISKTGFQMTQITDSLLLLASVRNIEDVKCAPLETAVILNNAWARLTNLVEQTNAQLIQPDNWPCANGYAPWIEEVWTNYLSNAIKYGGEPPQIEVGWDIVATQNGANQHVRFWIHDNGKGLTTEETDQLFQQYSRLEQHSKLQGHGLGLSIVKRILDKQGGTYGVESDLDKGSTFFFTLPIATEEMKAVSINH